MKLTAGGLLGTSAAGWFDDLAGRAAAAAGGKPAKRCILLWMSGGPAQTDTFDLKPGTASEGEFKPIDTNVPGIRVCEHLPTLAKHADKLALVRSMSTGEADHHRATYYMRTGYRQIGGTLHPSLGAVASAELGDPNSDLPNFIWVGGRPVGSGFLGAAHSPFFIHGDVTKPVENVRPGAKPDVFDKRFAALEAQDADFLARTGDAAAPEAHRTAYRQAVKLMRSSRLAAFNLEKEPEAVRAKYGKTRFGNACLLARRLVEVGVPFVGVSMDADWDTHVDNWERMRPYLPELDAGWSGLLADLKDRGMLDDTLVVWMGEFGRDPRINKSAKPGREHYAKAWTTVLAGGGIKAGQVVGQTDKLGMEVTERPVSNPDFQATLCKVLGIDFAKKNTTPDGRPIRIAAEGATPVAKLF